MGDHQASCETLGPFVGVDLDLWPTVYIAVIVLTRGRKMNEKHSKPDISQDQDSDVMLSDALTNKRQQMTVCRIW